MLSASLALLGGFCVIAFNKWRLGIFLTVVMAFLQDPLRKLTPGEPAIFIVFCAVVFAAAALRAATTGVPLLPLAIPAFARNARVPFVALLFILVIQGLNAYARFGAPLVPVLGLVNALAPFVALAFAYQFTRRAGLDGIRRVFLLYASLAIAALTTILLEYGGVRWPILGEVGVGNFISTFGGLEVYSGTFRAGEIAAWHAATASMVVILLLTADRPRLKRVAWAIAIVAAIVAIGVLTGRRKFIVAIVIFGSCYLALMSLYVRHSVAGALRLATAGVLVYLLGFGLGAPDPSSSADVPSEYELHVERTKTVFGDVLGRGYELGYLPITWAYQRFGLVGAGLGTATQGVNFAAGERYEDIRREIGGAGEGGLGKLMIELGALGLATAALLVIGLARTYAQTLRHAGAVSARAGRWSCGLCAILIANVAQFSVAAQAYGDFFILLFFGLCAGACLAVPEVFRREAWRRARAARWRASRAAFSGQAC